MKKVLWVFITFMTVMSMILVSCKSETTPTSNEGPTVIEGTVNNPLPETTKPVIQPSTEKPKYGGIATVSLSANINGFDEAFISPVGVYTLKLTNQELLMGDWTKGPAGTNEANFVHGGINAMDLKTGCLADSWEIPSRGKMIFHIREGVYWHNKAPTNGRELTVDDVVFSIKRMCTEPGAYIKMSFPTLAKTLVVTGDEATRMVTVECPLEEWITALSQVPDFLTIMPRDAIEKFGHMNDWQNSIGTGPFMLTDFVSNGSATFKSNPNYWEKNPIGPGKGDQLPYIDGVKLLIITDASTRLAGFRTGKIDSAGGEYDDVKEFLTDPEIKSMSYSSDSCYLIAMRTDKANLPFSKKEVRQALFLATDFNKIKDQYFSGRALILNWPIAYTKEYAAAYVPMEKLPANVQELYSHNVTKAKELLTKAGYPTGFETTIITYNTPAFVDYLSLIKEMWAEAGITLKIDAREYAVWVSRLRARNYDELFYFYSSAAWQRLLNFNGSSFYNMSYVNDSHVAEVYTQMNEYAGVDEAMQAKIHAELMPYVLEQCWVLHTPSAHLYVVWWPWRKNWIGELYIGYYNDFVYNKYIWLDTELKQEMTGRK
ncbi:MAG: hypothetical protein A2Z74_01150 [Chloroflexi bacterium RBG_13_46_9]|nr:MAG: hypothetical protein A2Z74_01150 [Chloroflexi bacterium RBG_13_46_9]